jgi:hypothetical protein
MAQRLENKQAATHGFKNTIEVARWGALEKSRGNFLKDVVHPGRVFDTVWEDDGWPVIPINPPIGVDQARLASHKTKVEAFSFSSGKYIEQAVTHPIDRVSVLTATSKMNAISFSLAAGPLKAHGTCLPSDLSTEAFRKRVGEVNGQGYADVEGTKKGIRTVDILEPGQKSITKSQAMGTWICDQCYAGKGNYAKLDSNQIFQIARKIWVDRHLAQGDFAQTMVDILRRTLSTDSVMRAKICSSEYFRIHDSGDFFPVAGNKFAYFDAWVEVAQSMPEVRFWCPTRMWIIPDWRDHMISTMSRPGAPQNLVIRPSALIYGVKAPKLTGLAAGSTSSAVPMKPEGHWDCPAYESPEGSCVGAGCRVCWNHPQLPVNYKVH